MCQFMESLPSQRTMGPRQRSGSSNRTSSISLHLLPGERRMNRTSGLWQEVINKTKLIVFENNTYGHDSLLLEPDPFFTTLGSCFSPGLVGRLQEGFLNLWTILIRLLFRLQGNEELVLGSRTLDGRVQNKQGLTSLDNLNRFSFSIR